MSDLGCYQNCTNCTLSGECCSHFDRINPPVLNKEELIKIRNFISKNDFYKKISDNLFQLKVENDKCIFYKNGKCSIYNYRPTDCKLYPFDIIKDGLNYYLVLYLLDCIDTEKMLKENIEMDNLVDSVIPWIEQFTDERNYTKMKKIKYKVIKEIK